jgi:CubicO group peptidase (beta-lactamase class C family)
MLITKITGQDYETVVKQQVLNPLGITRTQVGHSLYSIDGEVKYYGWPNSPSYPTMFPGSTPATISGDQNIPYGTWSLEAGRGAGGWIASSMDTLRFQLGVNGRGLVQVYPNIVNDIMSQTGQPSLGFDGANTYTINPNTDRYNAGWGVHWWGPPYNAFELDHGGGVNGGGSFTESIPNAPTVIGYGLAILINTSAVPGTSIDLDSSVRNAMLNVLSVNNGSLLDAAWSSDTDFFDQYGAFGAYTDAVTLNATIAASANGCTYNGNTYPACYASRLEGNLNGSTPHYRAQIVPLHSGDAMSYVLGADCVSYVDTQSSLTSAGYRQVNLQWYRDSQGYKRFQSVWVKINH